MTGDAIDKSLGTETDFFSALLDFLAMLIDACQKEYFSAGEALESSHDICQHFFISVPDVRWRVGVVDGGGDVVGLHDGKSQEEGGLSVEIQESKRWPFKKQSRDAMKMKRRLGNEPTGGAT